MSVSATVCLQGPRGLLQADDALNVETELVIALTGVSPRRQRLTEGFTQSV